MDFFRKHFLLFLAIIGFGFGFYFLPQGQIGKNVIGNLRGVGSCPNCGNSYWRNPTGNIEFMPGYAVRICNKCLAHPDELMSATIALNLRDRGWPIEDYFSVFKAVEQYKLDKKVDEILKQMPPVIIIEIAKKGIWI